MAEYVDNEFQEKTEGPPSVFPLRSQKSEIINRSKVIVIGAGMAGLAAAYFLKKCGLSVMVFERKAVAGGQVRTRLEEDRYLIELGPNSFLSSAEAVIKLARELSIDGQTIASQAASKQRYILHHKKLCPLPMGPKAFVSSRLFSLSGKARIFSECFVKSKTTGDESVASFIRRHFGNEALNHVVDPFVSGIYAGDVENLSAESIFPELVDMERAHGSLIRGFMKKRSKTKHDLFSFRWGMGTLPARLEEVLRKDLYLNTTIESIERLPNGRLQVKVEAPRKCFDADAIVLATPAPVSARIMASLLPQAIPDLMAIPYAPIIVVHTAYKNQHLPKPLDGFGFLIPRKEGFKMLGSIWSSSLFIGRAPKDESLLTNYIGGATDQSALDMDDREILDHIQTGLETSLQITAAPVFTSLRRIQQAIPQYVIGHRERLNGIEREAEKAPGIFLTGNYFRGVSVSDTIEHARHTADKVLSHLGIRPPLQR
ncbi:MAG: protoporphyrinogen oxidase [Deltaproteobacteria bacterium]|nr:protoporphyrinogen oxidase [Deltaproteobacteria bacterium]